mgnify:CR=1 FL=1
MQLASVYNKLFAQKFDILILLTKFIDFIKIKTDTGKRF